MSDALSYGFKKKVDGSIDAVEMRVEEALGTEGFGVLTRIDVAGTLRKKLDLDFKEYRILGACNPALAHRALTQEEDIGLLLPCNVIVYTDDEAGKCAVAVLDPVQQLAVSGRDDLGPLAEEVRDRMKRALDQV
ncbi:MAG: DUF302 domain-containing protein [Gemmatimonadota bacterium]|nr:DUF302 domain-containing protein [Gemmatimonadota bacterium]